MGWVNFSPLGSGFGFFDYARVQFRVFGFFSGSLQVQVFFLNRTYLCLIGGLVHLKVRVRWLGSGKNCLGLRKKYYDTKFLNEHFVSLPLPKDCAF